MNGSVGQVVSKHSQLLQRSSSHTAPHTADNDKTSIHLGFGFCQHLPVHYVVFGLHTLCL